MDLKNRDIIYSAFWRRALAFLIDCTVLSAVTLFWTIPFIHILLFGAFRSSPKSETPHFAQITNYPFFEYFNIRTNIVVWFIAIGILITVITAWIYFALMESSPKQGSLGKLTLGIKVTNLEGERISFGKATMRFFAKFISLFPLLAGFLMAAFTIKKQALHDMIAKTIVVEY
jgi:uncharacterized RDD family membrane protein YckC